FVCDFAAQYHGDYFHFAMGMRREALARLHNVVIEYSQRAKLKVRGVVIVVEREQPVSLQPSQIGEMTFARFDPSDHACTPSWFSSCFLLLAEQRCGFADLRFVVPPSGGSSY